MSEERQALDIEEQEAIGKAIVLMVQQCPFVQNRRITTRYEDMGDQTIGIAAQQRAVYLQRFLSGSFRGQYAFFLCYRVKPSTDQQKIDAQSFLEAVAKWLEGQEVTYNGTEYEPPEYPGLTDSRTIEDIQRTSNVYLPQAYENGSVDYMVTLQLQYLKRR